MVRAVIFDLDGALLDHEGAARRGLASLLNKLEVNSSSASGRLWEAWRKAERLHFDEYLRGECSFNEQRRRRLMTAIPGL